MAHDGPIGNGFPKNDWVAQRGTGRAHPATACVPIPDTMGLRRVNQPLAMIAGGAMLEARSSLPTIVRRRPKMRARIARLFTIKTRTEALCVIYALATGAAERGYVYIARFPGWGGKLLFGACMISVVMAGAKILDCLKYEAQAGKSDKR